MTQFKEMAESSKFDVQNKLLTAENQLVEYEMRIEEMTRGVDKMADEMKNTIEVLALSQCAGSLSGEFLFILTLILSFHSASEIRGAQDFKICLSHADSLHVFVSGEQAT